MPASPTFVDGVTPLNATTFNALGAVVDSKLDIPAGSNNQYLKRVSGLWVPANLSAGDLPGYPADVTKVLRGDGTWAVPSPKITSQAWATGPPASPADGDIWIATAVDAGGTVWQFRYNAGSASAYKWEFVGGPPAVVNVAASEGTGTIGAYTELTTLGPSVTVARGGDYVAQATAVPTIGSSGTSVFMGIALPPAVPVPAIAFAGAAAASGAMALGHKFTALAAATEIRMRYYVQQASDRFAFRVLAVTPVRVS